MLSGDILQPLHLRSAWACPCVTLTNVLEAWGTSEDVFIGITKEDIGDQVHNSHYIVTKHI